MTTPIAAPALEHLATLIVDVAPPQEVGHTPFGRRRVIPIVGGTVKGALLSGRILSGGADFQAIRSDTFTDIHALYVIETDDGETIYVANTGIRTGSTDELAALEKAIGREHV